jgi:two-component system, cell cycle sensor histidine kinase and response regulator CckA
VDEGALNVGSALNVLLVDDSADDAEIIIRELQRGGREISAERVFDASSMSASLRRRRWDLVLSDWTMPSFSGAAALELVKSAGVDLPFIIVSGTVTEDLAIKAMQSGARDWVLKDKLARLLPAVERELGEAAARKRAAIALRQNEEHLRQSQKMDAVGGLAAGVAHDFNNVLAVILGHADLLLGEPNLSNDMRESLGEIRGATVRAAELTQRLLAFGRQQVLQPRKTDLNQIVSGLDKMLRRLVGEDVGLVVGTADAAAVALVDPGQMEQVVLNLVTNAREAMPRGGTLTVQISNVHVDEPGLGEPSGLMPGNHVMLAVTDTGVGMDAATKARIFEPFFTTKTAGRGTGLGLATVFGIVQQSGGMITTDSESGRGTAFRVYLPQVDPEAGVDASPSEKTVSGAYPRGRGTILLVEDDAAVRVVTRTVLRNAGYLVLDVANGEEALYLAEKHLDAIDLVLSDVVMPRMSGPELAERLWAARPSLNVLYMSGYTAGAIVDRGVLAPGVAFLQKPVAPNVLVHKVREILHAGRIDPLHVVVPS